MVVVLARMNSIVVTTAYFDLDTGEPVVTLGENFEEVRARCWMSAEEALLTFSPLDGRSVPLGALEFLEAVGPVNVRELVKLEWLNRGLRKHEYVIVTRRPGTEDIIRVVSRLELRIASAE